jgi:hypothetical protein
LFRPLSGCTGLHTSGRRTLAKECVIERDFCKVTSSSPRTLRHSSPARPRQQRRRRRPLAHAVPDEAAADPPNAPRTKCVRSAQGGLHLSASCGADLVPGTEGGSPDRAPRRAAAAATTLAICRWGVRRAHVEVAAPAPRSAAVGAFSLGCLAADVGGCGVSSCAVVCRERLASLSMSWPMDG